MWKGAGACVCNCVWCGAGVTSDFSESKSPLLDPVCLFVVCESVFMMPVDPFEDSSDNSNDDPRDDSNEGSRGDSTGEFMRKSSGDKSEDSGVNCP